MPAGGRDYPLPGEPGAPAPSTSASGSGGSGNQGKGAAAAGRGGMAAQGLWMGALVGSFAIGGAMLVF